MTRQNLSLLAALIITSLLVAVVIIAEEKYKDVPYPEDERKYLGENEKKYLDAFYLEGEIRSLDDKKYLEELEENERKRLKELEGEEKKYKDVVYTEDEIRKYREEETKRMEEERRKYKDVFYLSGGKSVEFKKTDKIKVVFPQNLFVKDPTGQLPKNEKLFIAEQDSVQQVTIKFDLDNVEAMEFLDLQAKGGCLFELAQHGKHPASIAAVQFDPKKNFKAITLRIQMPCRRYYSIPDTPYESLLMVKVKTTQGYFYAVYKLYSSINEGT